VASIFITGSADGLGRRTAQRLVTLGHDVVLHGRDQHRAREAMRAVPGARTVLVGDLASIQETHALAEQANAAGPFQTVIHNAGVQLIHNAGVDRPNASRPETVDGLEETFVVNTLAPYLLTALIASPQRLVFLTSDLHRNGEPDLRDLQWRQRRWSGSQAYSNSKLFVVALAFGVARRWPHVVSNAVNPGWVPTKMGGPQAPDDFELGTETQVWLAVSDEQAALVSGQYVYHKRVRAAHPAAADVNFQNQLLDACAQLTGVSLSPAVAPNSS
jgi:NAD(P)-dependent dehydrogenase (short-subunit alcohol dehydrogenase family)